MLYPGGVMVTNYVNVNDSMRMEIARIDEQRAMEQQ